MVDAQIFEKAREHAMREFPFFPELGKLERGKVRDNYHLDERLISIATDRVSAFDVVMDEPIPFKGLVLTSIARHFFEQTTDVVPNHVVATPDPNVIVAKRCTPLPLEFIVRGYITGSAWKDYENGKRVKSGILLPEGLLRGQKFDTPIITNTTKAKVGHDEDISHDEIVERELLSLADLVDAERLQLSLYNRGVALAAKRGLILVDTKFEFGRDDTGEIIVIDEMLTPDSSRYWVAESYQELFAQGCDQRELSKEFLRAYLKSVGFSGEKGSQKPSLPSQVIVETAARYIELYERITGHELLIDTQPVAQRIERNLRQAGLIKGGYVQILAGSKSDSEHYGNIWKHLRELGVPCGVEVLSAHKQTRELLAHMELLATSAEPVVYITVAGRSNALGGIVASPANNKRGFPVINCPPFKDTASYAVDIHSSLRMPSDVPALTVLEPKNAALAARNILYIAGAKFDK